MTVARLQPRDEGFFGLFERCAANLEEGARRLDALLTDYRDLDAKVKAIEEIEHAGDRLTREAIEKLNRSFLAPFDRDEVHALVCRMDDVLDRMDEAASRMRLYRVEKPTEDAKALARVLVRATALIREIVPLLRDLKQPNLVLDRCRAIEDLESEGDKIEKHALAALFASGTSALDVIRWKDVYADLENATDSCSDVANVLEAIVLRHA